MRNADGSLSLGAMPAAPHAAPTIENGVIVFDRGRLAHYNKAAPPALAPKPAISAALRRKDEIPFLGPLDLVGDGLVMPGTGLRIR